MRHRARRRLPLFAAGAVAAAVFVTMPSARAACHAFTISVDPASVEEGGQVTVTVRRDAGVNPSSVDVSSVDGSARADEDYERVQRTVQFTSEVEQSFPVATIDDPDAEPAETFKLHLSNPGGCAVNPNFSLGPDAEVTIAASDAAPPPPATNPPATTAPPATNPPATTAPEEEPSTTTAATTAAEDTTSTAATDEPVASPTTTAGNGEGNGPEDGEEDADTDTTALAVGASDDGDGGSGAAVAFAVIAAILALGGAGAYLFVRRRTAGP